MTSLRSVAEGCILKADHSAEQLSRTEVGKETVAGLESCEAGKTIGDLVALNIGQIGENMAVGEASLFSAGAGVKLAAQCHPSISR